MRATTWPNGEQQHTITTQPMEVDSIATESWQAIYHGNAEDQHDLVNKFLQQYDEHIHDAKEFTAREIIAQRLQNECTTARASAGGLDQWAPDEFALLSLKAFHHLAEMLKLIGNGAEWPTNCLHARASYLSKDHNDLLNPLSYRVLLMLPEVYRRWASLRLHNLAPWVADWQLDAMCARVASKFAEDGWWGTNLILEKSSHCTTTGNRRRCRYHEMF